MAPLHAMKWMYSPAPLSTFHCPLHRRRVGSQSRCWCCGEQINMHLLALPVAEWRFVLVSKPVAWSLHGPCCPDCVEKFVTNFFNCGD